MTSRVVQSRLAFFDFGICLQVVNGMQGCSKERSTGLSRYACILDPNAFLSALQTPIIVQSCGFNLRMRILCERGAVVFSSRYIPSSGCKKIAWRQIVGSKDALSVLIAVDVRSYRQKICSSTQFNCHFFKKNSAKVKFIK